MARALLLNIIVIEGGTLLRTLVHLSTHLRGEPGTGGVNALRLATTIRGYQ
jgi:hypothetical protein